MKSSTRKSFPGITEKITPCTGQSARFLPDTPTCRAEIAQYYQSVSRIDQGLGALIQHIKDAKLWKDTLFLFIADHGIAMPGAKTTLYEGGMRSPCLVRNPYEKKRGVKSGALVSWVDLVPTLSTLLVVLERRCHHDLLKNPHEGTCGQKSRQMPGTFHGRSFLSILGQTSPKGWDEVYASHTFHEITMYYPMRVVRERKYKLIWNIAHELPYPFASDLWAAPTWQAQYKLGMSAPYGMKTVGGYIHRDEFELYDLEADPHEGKNLAGSSSHRKTLDRLKTKLKSFQQETRDPWVMKWRYE